MSQPKKRQRPPARIQNVFVFLLLAVFAISAIFLTALSAQVYRDTVQVSAQNNTERIIDAVIRGAVQSEDCGQVSVREERAAVTDEDGEITGEETLKVLAFTNDYDGEIYLRRLYCAGGWLWESVTAEEYGFTEGMGESLIEAVSFEPEINGNLLTAKVVTPDGAAADVSVYLWAGGAAE